MLGTLGFSYIGLIFLVCLFVPNILFGLNQPKDRLVIKENRLLLALERIGQVLTTVLILVFDDLNPHGAGPWTAWLIAVGTAMALYLLCWVRYFAGPHIERDFYRPFLLIPLPLAVLPVAAALMLAVYARVIWLGITAVVLGIGHIGVTAQHWAALRKSPQ